MGYTLKRDGWLNNFTDEKNQSMKEYGVPWRGARKKRPEFFSILFSVLMDNDIIIWIGNVTLVCSSIFCIFSLCFSKYHFLLYLFNFPFIFVFLHLLYFDVLGGSIIACRSFNVILWRSSLTSTSTSPSSSPCMSKSTLLGKLPHNGNQFLLLFPGRWRRAIFYLLCA